MSLRANLIYEAGDISARIEQVMVAEQDDLSVDMPAADRQHLMGLLPEMPERLLIRKRREDRLSQEDRAALKALGYVE